MIKKTELTGVPVERDGTIGPIVSMLEYRGMLILATRDALYRVSPEVGRIEKIELIRDDSCGVGK